ncbi:MAG: LptF/LptG family permease [Gemmatimonadota bacterium]
MAGLAALAGTGAGVMVGLRRLDRYVLWEFTKILLVAQAALSVIFVLIHLMDHIDIYLDHEASWPTVGRYYLYLMPYNMLLTLPMAMLIATILAIGDFGRHGELTAMKSSGQSLYRIVLPLIVAALLISLATLGLGETLVPRLNQFVNKMYEEEILGEGGDYENYRGNFVYQNTAGYTYLVRAMFVDDSATTTEQVEIQRKLDDGTFLRINAPTMLWEDGRQMWVMRDGELRLFPPQGGDERMYTFTLLRAPGLEETPRELLAEEKEPEEMGYRDLEAYIIQRERLGAEVRNERVDLQVKLSYPFANLIIVLFGVALVGSAAHAGRQSAGVGFGLALFLTMVFWGFLRVGQGIGYGGGLGPVTAAWLANGVFGVMGLVLFARART